ncbi:MAG TPA: type II toxin-antitoxin system PemK/MazF family toxin [Chloroflexota bacterium]|nr:type II toxin-antitoxin system PemK/MazF family toxin [Chloroflexota bacterium]
MTAAVPRRGDVWLAQLAKVRPVIILTRDPLAGLLNAVIVAPITSMVRGFRPRPPWGSRTEYGTTDTRVQSTLQDFERLSAAFFAELERKFL